MVMVNPDDAADGAGSDDGAASYANANIGTYYLL